MSGVPTPERATRRTKGVFAWSSLLIGLLVAVVMVGAPIGRASADSISTCDQTQLQSLINSGGTVGFSTDCHLDLTAPLTVPVGDDVTISGAGHSVVLDGLDPQTQTNSQVLNVQGSLTLQSLTITNGYAVGSAGTNGMGGGEIVPPACEAAPDGTGGTDGQDGQGGGLYVAAGATATASNVTFSNDNAAGGVGGNGGDGGFSLSIGDCQLGFYGSGYDGGGGGDGGSGGNGQGGAIFNAGTLTVTGSTFASDTASGGSGGFGGDGGAGGDGWGTGFASGNGGSGGDAGDGANGEGGAIYSSGTLTVQSSSFVGNGADGGPGGYGGLGGAGGNGEYSIGFSPADSGDGGDGGNGGNAGNATGGAIWDSPDPGTLTGLTFTHDTVASGNSCDGTIGGAGCGGFGGDQGVAAPVPPCQMVGGTTYCYTPGSDGNAGNDGTNGAGGSAASVDLYTATPIPVSITTTSLPTGIVGHFYAATVGISGGEGPFTWSEAGPLPPGLRFDASTGLVTGTPKATGSYSITAQVTDNGDPGSQPVSQPLTITVDATAPGFQISTASLPAAQPKTAYGPFQLRTTGASAGASFKWQKVSLPKGIKLSKTGVLSGTLGKKLQAGTSAQVSVRVTETVVTKVGKKKVKTRTVASDSWTLAIT